MSEIIPRLLYLGSQCSTTLVELEQRNISEVVSIGCVPLSNQKGIKYHYFDVDDCNSIANVEYFFSKVIPLIHQIIDKCLQNNIPVLIHCQAGISRSASVIITWLMLRKYMTFDDAYITVKNIRTIINPNRGFIDYMKSM